MSHSELQQRSFDLLEPPNKNSFDPFPSRLQEYEDPNFHLHVYSNPDLSGEPPLDRTTRCAATQRPTCGYKSIYKDQTGSELI